MTKLTDAKFHNEDAARAHLEALRWPDGPYCPHCANSEPTTIRRLEGKSHRPGLHQCNECREHFTVTVGTVMERSHIPLAKWVLGFHLMNASKKGMSAHQLHRMLGITYKSAWFMAMRIREAMRDESPSAMGGPDKPVQADETYYGATSSRATGHRRRRKEKAIVVGLVDQTTGAARGFHVTHATGDTIRDILFTNVTRRSTLVSDESNLYRYAGKAFGKHETVTQTRTASPRTTSRTFSASSRRALSAPTTSSVRSTCNGIWTNLHSVTRTASASALTTGNVRRLRSVARRASVSRIGGLVQPRTRRQQAQHFLRWRKRQR
jgi:transposase-like protein